MSRRKVNEHQRQGRHRRWIERDPVQSQVWRYAWDLLLEDRHSLEDICDALHARGYTRQGGTPFVKILPNGKRKYYKSILSATFHNPFYAGLIYVHHYFDDEDFKVVQGEWEAIVTPEEFEAGLAILEKRDGKRNHRPRHFYLLQGLLYLQHADGTLTKLTCSTPNANRQRGGVSYYCIPSGKVDFLCYQIDTQVAQHLHGIQVDPRRLPHIRAAYTAEVAKRFQSTQTDSEVALKLALDEIRQEEANAARLQAKGKISDEVYEELWREWQDRRTKIMTAMSTLHAQDPKAHVETLDAALNLIAKAGILFDKLERQRKRDLLRYMVERFIINSQGKIVRAELRAPFSYLCELIAERGGQSDAEKWFDLGSAGPTSLNENRTSSVPAGSIFLPTRSKPEMFTRMATEAT